jgi:predicted small lipoprotein YifL
VVEKTWQKVIILSEGGVEIRASPAPHSICYICATFPEHAVTDPANRRLLRAAVTAALALALGLTLSACGRKGALDAPPDGQGFYPLSSTQPDVDAQGRPIAPPGQKKRIPLDVLLD